MIVVDTQIIVYATTGGPHEPLAREVSAVDPDWHVPPLWRSEYLNVLAGQMRRGAIGLDQARAFIVAAALLIVETPTSSDDILALANTSSCTAYDLEYVAVAQSLGIPLVTNDQQILRDFPTIAVSLESFAGGSA